jgi:hypothetical protein
MRQTTVWVSPSATSFSCLCESCLEQARTAGMVFADALLHASVRGTIGIGADVSSRRCQSGHEIVLRRVERPATLPHHDDRQLQLA